MVTFSIKFGVNPVDDFRENCCYGRTTDARVMTVAQKAQTEISVIVQESSGLAPLYSVRCDKCVWLVS